MPYVVTFIYQSAKHARYLPGNIREKRWYPVQKFSRTTESKRILLHRRMRRHSSAMQADI